MPASTVGCRMLASISASACCTWLLRTAATCASGFALLRNSVAATTWAPRAPHVICQESVQIQHL